MAAVTVHSDFGAQENKVSQFPLYSCLFAMKQASFNFMAAVTVHSDFGAQENKVSQFPLYSCLFAMKWWDWMPWS